jgi:hypothetical protein
MLIKYKKDNSWNKCFIDLNNSVLNYIVIIILFQKGLKIKYIKLVIEKESKEELSLSKEEN